MRHVERGADLGRGRHRVNRVDDDGNGMLHEELSGGSILRNAAARHSGLEHEGATGQQLAMTVLGEPSLDVRGRDGRDVVSITAGRNGGPLRSRLRIVVGELARRTPGWCVMRGAARRVGRGVGRVVVFCRREHDKIRERESASDTQGHDDDEKRDRSRETRHNKYRIGKQLRQILLTNGVPRQNA